MSNDRHKKKKKIRKDKRKSWNHTTGPNKRIRKPPPTNLKKMEGTKNQQEQQHGHSKGRTFYPQADAKKTRKQMNSDTRNGGQVNDGCGQSTGEEQMDTETGRTILTRMEPTKTTKLTPNTTNLTLTGQKTNPRDQPAQSQQTATALTMEPKQKKGDHKRERQQTNTKDVRQTEDRHTHQKGETRTDTKGSNKGDNQVPRRMAHAIEERPRDHLTTMGDQKPEARTKETNKVYSRPKTN